MQNDRETAYYTHRRLSEYGEKIPMAKSNLQMYWTEMINQSSSNIWKVFKRTVSMTRFCQPESIRLAPEAPIRVGPKQMARLPAVMRLLLACSWTLFKCCNTISTHRLAKREE